MKADDLISKLSSELKPIKPLESFWARFFKWLLTAALCVSAGIALFGLREDWRTVFETPTLLLQNILILASAVCSAAAALLLSVPGHERSFVTKMLVAVPIVLWTTLLILGNSGTAQFHAGLGLHCLRNILVFGFVPGIFLFFLVQKGAALMRGYVGFLALLASAGIGAWGLQFTCHDDQPAHILLWHFLPLLITGVIGIKIGKSVLPKI